jgi:hypothetical protein
MRAPSHRCASLPVDGFALGVASTAHIGRAPKTDRGKLIAPICPRSSVRFPPEELSNAPAFWSASQPDLKSGRGLSLSWDRSGSSASAHCRRACLQGMGPAHRSLVLGGKHRRGGSRALSESARCWLGCSGAYRSTTLTSLSGPRGSVPHELRVGQAVLGGAQARRDLVAPPQFR